MKHCLLLLSISSLFVFGQENVNQSKRTLFIGNSYTSVNNLPEMTRLLALSASDTLIYDVNAPGGQTFQGHFADVTTTNKIAQGNWDYVVLQEQSQRPSFPDSQVEVEVFPFAKKLDSLVKVANSCTETMFYMTWGRKNGDAQNCQFFPPLCTYEGMDSLLYLRYMQMAENNSAIVSPVGALWNYLRENYPAIELYSADESHPSLAGTYAAACSFYSGIFKETPLNITNDYGLSASDALAIRASAKIVVFDSLSKWFIGSYAPVSNFTFTLQENRLVNFANTSVNATEYFWSFGDETYSNEQTPTHTFTTNGPFEVTLSAISCGDTSIFTQTILYDDASLKSLEAKKSIIVYPNPSSDIVNFSADKSVYKVLIYNLLGEKVKQIEVKDTTNFSVSNLGEGIYNIKFFYEDGLSSDVQFVKGSRIK